MSERNRLLATLTALALLIGVIAWGWATSPANAQDNVEDRLADLEARVADQDEAIDELNEEIDRLEERITDLEAERSGDTGGESGDGERQPGNGVDLTFEGTTDFVTEPFVVEPGTLRFTAVYSGGSNFIVTIYDDAGNWDLVFNEIGPYEGQRVVQVAGPGDFALGVTAGEVFLEVQGQGSWSIRVSQ